jgi:hypothetical protein
MQWAEKKPEKYIEARGMMYDTLKMDVLLYIFEWVCLLVVIIRIDKKKVFNSSSVMMALRSKVIGVKIS